MKINTISKKKLTQTCQENPHVLQNKISSLNNPQVKQSQWKLENTLKWIIMVIIYQKLMDIAKAVF